MNPAMSRMLVGIQAGHFVDVPFVSYSQEAAIAAYAGWRAPQWANPSVVRTMERFGYAQYDVIATRFFGRSSTRGVGNQAFLPRVLALRREWPPVLLLPLPHVLRLVQRLDPRHFV